MALAEERSGSARPTRAGRIAKRSLGEALVAAAAGVCGISGVATKFDKRMM